MDKNSITAIVLTFLLVFLYMHFYGPKPKAAQQISTTNTVVQTEPVASSEANALETAVKKSEEVAPTVFVS